MLTLAPSSADDSVSVAVVAICSLPQLERCLDSLVSQREAPDFEVIVAADTALGDLSQLRAQFPSITLLSREGCRTPIELAAMAIQSCSGARILLTEDSCVAHHLWVATLAATAWQGRGAVGGLVEPREDASPAAWAFCYVDFFRYMRPASEGITPSLSVCNVAYHRSHLTAIAHLWQTSFLETEVHAKLRDRFGPLWLSPESEVRVRRNVRFGDALYERYAFGRLFGATRMRNMSIGRRLSYVLLAPALPALLFRRLAAKAVASPETAALFRRALPALVALVFAWSWGEWLGYLTGRRPRRITTAPEVGESTE
ncbi:MAG: hypothetical protein H0T48_11810 [Gemmatimonadaceae bacterium]|nr:hypothetical protein [Gemmatimonadaceae bacterium]